MPQNRSLVPKSLGIIVLKYSSALYDPCFPFFITFLTSLLLFAFVKYLQSSFTLFIILFSFITSGRSPVPFFIMFSGCLQSECEPVSQSHWLTSCKTSFGCYQLVHIVELSEWCSSLLCFCGIPSSGILHYGFNYWHFHHGFFAVA